MNFQRLTVLISHDHYDHLDMDSMNFFKDKKTPFLTTLGVGSHIEGWGIASDRIIENKSTKIIADFKKKLFVD